MKRRRSQIIKLVTTLCLVITTSILLVATTKSRENQVTEIVPQTTILQNRNVFAEPEVGANQIFFIEGSCGEVKTSVPDEDKEVKLDTTQACAIESAAKTNPEASVYLYYTCPLDHNSIGRSSEIIQQIFQRYNNLFVWHQSLASLLNGTEMEEFYHSGKMLKSRFSVNQHSNVARIFLLWKYGGTYLDLDFIVRRSLSPLADNFVGMQAQDNANNAAVRFSSKGVGRHVAELCLKEIRDNFNGDVWGHNGPGLITRVFKRFCDLSPLRAVSPEECHGFAIYPMKVFYAVTAIEWKQFYDDRASARTKILYQIKDSFAVHLWSSMTKHDWFTKKQPHAFRDSRQPKMLLQQKYCPIAHTGNEVDRSLFSVSGSFSLIS